MKTNTRRFYYKIPRLAEGGGNHFLHTVEYSSLTSRHIILIAMGNERSSEYLSTPNNPDRLIFISFESFRHWPAESYRSRFNSFNFIIKYQRYYWTISKRFSDIITLDSKLLERFPEKIDRIKCPRKYRKLFWAHTDELLTRRAKDLVAYLQTILDDREIFESNIVQEFLEIGQVCVDR